MSECIAPGCHRDRIARGVCKRCYDRLKRAGLLDEVALPPAGSTAPSVVAYADRVAAEWLATPWRELLDHQLDRFCDLLDALGPECVSTLREMAS